MNNARNICRLVSTADHARVARRGVQLLHQCLQDGWRHCGTVTKNWLATMFVAVICLILSGEYTIELSYRPLHVNGNMPYNARIAFVYKLGLLCSALHCVPKNMW